MKKKKKKSAVRRTDIDKVKRKLDELGGSFFKAKEGKNIVRILPPWNDEGVFYYEASSIMALRMRAETELILVSRCMKMIAQSVILSQGCQRRTKN